MADHAELGQVVVLKGAHAIEALTGIQRSTRDIDLTARRRFVERGKEGAAYLKRVLREALEDHLEAHATEWSVYDTSAKPSPSARPHRFGWDGYLLKATLMHLKKRQYVVEIDLSFGDLTEGTVSLAWRDDGVVVLPTGEAGSLACYCAEQAVAEKLRAWLQKLPPYLRKVGGGDAPPRVRDLRDIHVLLSRTSPLDWEQLGRSFMDKCAVRFVDCSSPADLLPDGLSIELVRSLYDADESLADVPFDVAWASVEGLVRRLESMKLLPGVVPLPEGPHST